MPKRNGNGGHEPDADLLRERLKRHLEFLGLNLTLDTLDETLADVIAYTRGGAASVA